MTKPEDDEKKPVQVQLSRRARLSLRMIAAQKETSLSETIEELVLEAARRRGLKP